MRTRSQFNEFWRKFYLIATYLFEHGVISKKDQSEKLMNGLPDALQRRVKAQLRIQYPTHHPNDPYELKEIFDAVTFILTSFDTDLDDKLDGIFIGGNRTQRNDPIPLPVAPAASAVTTRQVYDATQLPEPQPTNQIDQLVKMFSNMMETFTTALANNQPGGVTMSNSNGKDFAERIDNWNRAHTSAPTNIVSSNLFDVVEEPEILPVATAFIKEVTSESRAEQIDVEADDIAYYKALKAQAPPNEPNRPSAASNASKTVTTPVPTTSNATARQTVPAQGNSNLKANTIQKDSRTVSFAPVTSFMPPVTPESFPKSQNANLGPQFHYTTPIEDPKVVQLLAERSLDSTVTLTTRELLSVAPDVRKVVKEKVTTKRVPAAGFVNEAHVGEVGVGGSVEVMLNTVPMPLNTSGKVMAREMETLRMIDVTLNDKVSIEALLDHGSQIIGIRRSVWEKIGLPLCSDCIITMESANRSRNDSMGLLTNLKMRVGDIDFFVQAQVMDNVSYDVLLGRPFHTLTQAYVKHFTNGDTHATLTNPNSGTVVTVPTKP
ncbi:hypothetical protein H1R20_g13350, partial [Candolleomyces eurysporus]